MRLPDHLRHACPPRILAMLEQLWSGAWTREQFSYGMAHYIAANLSEYALLPLSVFRDAESQAEAHRRNCNRRQSLVEAADTLRKGDPSVPPEKRDAKSAGDRIIAARVEAYAREQFGHDWRAYERDRQRSAA